MQILGGVQHGQVLTYGLLLEWVSRPPEWVVVRVAGMQPHMSCWLKRCIPNSCTMVLKTTTNVGPIEDLSTLIRLCVVACITGLIQYDQDVEVTADNRSRKTGLGSVTLLLWTTKINLSFTPNCQSGPSYSLSTNAAMIRRGHNNSHVSKQSLIQQYQ
jgi:hypothetical protein